MIRGVLIIVIALISTSLCNAQQIESEKVFGGYTYYQNGKALSMKSLIATMENTEAFEVIKEAKSKNTLANILGGVGGFMIGYPLGTSIGGGDANWTLAGVGAGLIVIALPISSKANKKTKEAIDIYNTSLKTSSFHYFEPQFKMLANGKGIGLTMQF